MKKLLLSTALFALVGCCDHPEAHDARNMGTYSTATATVVRKYNVPGSSIDHADLRIDGKVYPCEVPSRLWNDDIWWANLVDRDTYKVLIEEKNGKRYIWSYEAPLR